MMTFMPSICFAAEKADSAILHNLWSHAQRNPSSIEGVEQNVYTCFHFKTVRRNVTLPSWIDYAAEKAKVNVSKILQEALIKELGLTRIHA